MHDHHHHTLDASESASVVLDIGADVGALVLYVAPAEHGREIEISPVATPDQRTHAAVRERIVESGSIFCIVYAGLVEGDYTIWGDATIPVGSVHVAGGEITELDWSDRTVI
jgi:hypothetical protein